MRFGSGGEAGNKGLQASADDEDPAPSGPQGGDSDGGDGPLVQEPVHGGPPHGQEAEGFRDREEGAG